MTPPKVARTIFNVYHANCNDGVMSAAIVKKFCEENWMHYEPYPMTYGSDENKLIDTIHTLPENSYVLVTDFSIHPNIIKDLPVNVIILDHHKSYRELIERLGEDTMPENMAYIYEPNKAGCQITWDYFYQGKQAPFVLQLIADRDLWTFTYPETKPLTAVIREYGMDIDTWIQYLESDNIVEDIIEQGEHVSKYNELKFKNLADRLASSITDKPILINISDYHSEILNTIVSHPEYKYSYAIGFTVSPYGVKCSVRSIDGHSAEDVATNFVGGGGHGNAAGFTIPLTELGTLLNEYSFK